MLYAVFTRPFFWEDRGQNVNRNTDSGDQAHGFQKRDPRRKYCKGFVAKGILEIAGTRNSADRPHIRDLLGGLEGLPLSGDERGDRRGTGRGREGG